jgi:DNA-binding SARP family transcriptional activator
VKACDVARPSPRPLQVALLGPLTLTVDGVTIDVPGPRQRALLALLALAEGRTVTVGHLLDALWPAVALESGRRSLHSNVSRLRATSARRRDAW